MSEQPLDFNALRRHAAFTPAGPPDHSPPGPAPRARPSVGVGSIAVGVLLGMLMWSAIMWVIGRLDAASRPPAWSAPAHSTPRPEPQESARWVIPSP